MPMTGAVRCGGRPPPTAPPRTHLLSCSTDSRYQHPPPQALHPSTRSHSLKDLCSRQEGEKGRRRDLDCALSTCQRGRGVTVADQRTFHVAVPHFGTSCWKAAEWGSASSKLRILCSRVAPLAAQGKQYGAIACTKTMALIRVCLACAPGSSCPAGSMQMPRKVVLSQGACIPGRSRCACICKLSLSTLTFITKRIESELIR